MPKNNHAEAGAAPAARTGVWRVFPAVLFVLAVLNLLFFALALRPAGERARGEREGLQRLQTDLHSRRETVGRLRDIESKLGEARRQDVEFYQQKFLPRETGFSTIMEELEKLAQANHVRKGGVSYSLTDVPGHPELSQVDIMTVLDGEYANIVQFVNQVERDPLFLLVDQIAAAGATMTLTPNQPKPVRLSLRLVTYFRG